MKKILIFGASLTMLYGCASTPTDQIQAFGTSATVVTEKVDMVIQEYRKSNVSKELINMASLGNRLSEADFDYLDKALIKQTNYQKSALSKATKSLSDYSKNLAKLASVGSKEDFSIAGANLSSSIMDFKEQYQNLTDNKEKELIKKEDAATLGRIFAEISYYHAERKRATALKSIIISTDDAIQELALAIEKGLLEKPIAQGIYSYRSSRFSHILDEYNNKLPPNCSDNGGTEVENANCAELKQKYEKKGISYSHSEQLKDLELIKDEYLLLKGTIASIEQAKEAIKSVASVHAKLKEAVSKNEFNSEEVFEALKKLKVTHEGFDALEELILSCETQVVTGKQGLECKKKDE